MRKVIKLVVIFLLFMAGFVVAQNYPSPRGAVNDFANVIPTEIENQIEVISREVWQKTGTAIVDVTVESMDGDVIENYAVELYEKWGIGKKGEDKGVLILNAIQERKIRIEAGYGVEGILPDGKVGQILDDYAIPNLKKGDYGRAHLSAVSAVAHVIAEDAGVELNGVVASNPQSNQGKSGSSWIGRIISLLIIFLIFGTRGRALPWIILGSLLGGGGPRDRGGFGGGFGGGGFSGGFGGFGGGMSGGGGASRGY